MNDLKQEIREIILGMNLGYEYLMSDYASTRKQELEYKTEGLKEVDQATTQILKAVEQWGESESKDCLREYKLDRWGRELDYIEIKAVPLSAFKQLSEEK